MQIETRHLRYFLTVAEELHFGRASARLHMTQPPLSQAIQAFEALLGTPLFERSSKRSVSLTAAGIALLPEARRILAQTGALPDLAQRAASGASGKLSLAFVSSADYSVLPPALRSFRERFPQVEIELREATSDMQLADLLEGRIDCGLLIPPLPDRAKLELDYAPILREPLMLAAPTGLRALRGKRSIAIQQLPDLPLVIFPRRIAPAFYDAILAALRDAGIVARIGQEAIQMQTIVSLVSAGMGIALVPQSVSNLKRTGVQYVGLSGHHLTVETGVAWRRSNHSPVLAEFLDLLGQKPC
ncbi:MAG TPA: LysR family transcriptional regulator [Pseudoxanthomonas sp.]